MRDSHPLLADIESVAPYSLTEAHSLYDVPAPVMQIKEFLPAGGIMGITSFPGVGKTWLALEVARSIASGTPFLGKFEARRGGVLFVGSDSSIFDYARQWTRLTKGQYADAAEREDIFEGVRFLIQSSFLFEDLQSVRQLLATHQRFEFGEMEIGPEGEPVRPRGFKVIIFDTLSRLTRANQNDNTQMEEVFRHVRWIAETTGAAIILLHHNSKHTEFNDGADWRGAMSQIGALDSWVQLSNGRHKKYTIGGEFKKFRGITPKNFAYQMSVDDPRIAALAYSTEPVTREDKQERGALGEAIYTYISEHPDKNAREICEALTPRFEVGVADVDGTTVTYPPDKMKTAVNNSLATLHRKLRVMKGKTGGRISYRVIEAQAQPDAPRTDA